MGKTEEMPTVRAWEITLRTVSRLLRIYDGIFRKWMDLPLTWYDVLVSLIGAPGNRMRIQTLADSVVLTRPGMTRLIDSIEQAGLVRREAVSGDRRGYYVVLTEEGRKKYEAASVMHLEDLEETFGRYLTQDDLKDLHRIMSKVWDGSPGLGSRADQS